MMLDGRPFQTRPAETVKTWSPTVTRRVRGTCSSSIEASYCENKASFGSYLSLTFLRKLAKLSKTVHVLYVKVIASERLNGGTM